jgi:hypothetical protein
MKIKFEGEGLVVSHFVLSLPMPAGSREKREEREKKRTLRNLASFLP